MVARGPAIEHPWSNVSQSNQDPFYSAFFFYLFTIFVLDIRLSKSILFWDEIYNMNNNNELHHYLLLDLHELH